MDIEWDEAKRRSNIAKHGLDFIDADLIFLGEHKIAQARTVSCEERWLATGMIHGLRAAVIFTMRGQTVRIISLRRSRHGE
ncbi:BrnT family toxin [Acidisoma cellulosilytica]|uniref:BrnT family toxin n=1 Tax=Acidisoma cellulosilyticum TaxID=2802395 RepID=A0A963YYG4_9PROT|nr:BrnT family toxin [Acidisoma cellulosilyticum]MCB8879295.1 BrnT family toxin [Acidisoma cellulosilyticum]